MHSSASPHTTNAIINIKKNYWLSDSVKLHFMAELDCITLYNPSLMMSVGQYKLTFNIHV